MKKVLCLFICLVLVMSITSTAYADNYNINEIMTDTADYIYTTLDSPGVSSVGGEWAILGLARFVSCTFFIIILNSFLFNYKNSKKIFCYCN